MYTAAPSSLASRSRNSRAERAFSLVEVVLALGVFSFAMISMVALIPSGLMAYQQASNTTAQGQIIETVTSQIELTGIANIAPTQTNYYYFDNQGTELTNGTSTSVASSLTNLLYTATVSFATIGSNTSPGSAASLFTSLTNSSAYDVKIAVTRVSQPQRTNYFSTVIAY